MISAGWSLDINAVSPVSPPADLGIAVTGTPATITVGSSAVYSIMITNNGPATAPGVVVTDTLPSGFSLASNLVSQGSVTVTGGTVTWSAGDLAANSTAQMTLRVVPAVVGFFASVATVTGAYSDSNSANNSAQATTLVSAGNAAYLSGAFVNGVFQLTVSGQPGASYDVQASASLSTWQSLGVHVMPPGGTLTVTDTNSTGLQTRYYRTVRQGP